MVELKKYREMAALHALKEMLYLLMAIFPFHFLKRIRRVCHFVVTLRYFDLFIMIVICASSIALAAEDPVQVFYTNKSVLKYLILSVYNRTNPITE